MTVRFYSSIAQQTTLTGTYSPSATSIAVAGTTGFPSSTPYTLSLDYGQPNEELVEVTGVAGLSLTVTRAIDGTSATTHNAGAVVRHVSSARDFADSRAHENASTAVHGISGAVVGTTDTQTLTNKTLGSGTVFSGSFTLNNPNITGTVTGGATYSGITLGGSTTASGNVVVNGAVAATNQLDVRGAASQSGALQRWLDSSSNNLANIDSTGKLLLNRTGAVGTNNAALTPWTITGAASQTADLLLVRDSGSVAQVEVLGNGTFQANKGVLLVGDPSPSTGAVTVKAGPSSNNIQVWQNASGTQEANMDPNGVLVANGLTVLNTVNTPAWVSFTPLWTSTGTAPAIGNGTLTGRFYEQGKLVVATWLIKFGTTTTFGTGTWGFSYPSGRQPKQNAIAELTYCGAARGHTTVWSSGTAAYDQGTDSFRIFTNGSSTEWSPTVPVTWTAASSNYIEFTVTYEQV